MPGMKPGCRPERLRMDRGWEPGFQPLTSPIAVTWRALGAHTPRNVPDSPSTTPRCAPSFSYMRLCVPSLNRNRSSEFNREALWRAGNSKGAKSDGDRSIGSVIAGFNHGKRTRNHSVADAPKFRHAILKIVDLGPEQDASRRNCSANACAPGNRSLAPAPAVLQGSRHRRVSLAVGAAARPEGLLRHGEAAGRVSQRASDVQFGAVAGHADSGLCGGDGQGPFFGGGG